ncbi:MAG TPA: PQQ-dependent sugar dehydrogenase, partial [Polyangiaceae bacterium]|nr:PQQ-dependent sugar dehydrogenase [Polyangiaceae bacterium]
GGTGGGGTGGGGGSAGTSAGTGGQGGDDGADAGSTPSSVSLTLVASGLVAPIALRPAPDDSGRLFVADQTGVIRVIEGGTLSPTPVLDLTDRMLPVDPTYDERGFLGFALHPDFENNGRVFVHYSAPARAGAPDGFDHTSVIAEVSLAAADGGPNERVILEVDHPQSNHNGGAIAFGPDGYLYIGFGDGGAANDVALGHVDDWYEVNEGGNGQDRTTNLLGSILRIDVNGTQPYAVPADNPFADSPMPEVWAYGFRNPFQFSFDRGGTNQLFAGDVGQNLWEEVDIVTSGSNYGWNVKEGTHCFSTASPSAGLADCPDADPDGVPLVDPIIEYASANQDGGVGLSVIAGHVYRGTALPELAGKYVFADWSTSFSLPDGHLFVASPPAGGGGPWSVTPLAIEGRDGTNIGEYVLSVGEDAAGELYLLTSEVGAPSGTTGKVYKIER